MRRCDGAPSGGHRTADGVPIVREAKGGPELPLHDCQFTAEDGEAYSTFKRARTLLAQRCMRDFGFAGLPRDPKSPRSGSVCESARRGQETVRDDMREVLTAM
ncbi:MULTISPECIES: hypothetical protein [Streptomyces]|uniref:hypothetical protein n=1 Tax=Streptomyces TaxID=1883 RepID=UPI002DDC8A6F|nr:MULTISPECIES: hypothetical protein [unclassified Streptomyces]WSD96178.1 hypothetical protein OG758_19735 [Streptomyces sp. NBC_01474]